MRQEWALRSAAVKRDPIRRDSAELRALRLEWNAYGFAFGVATLPRVLVDALPRLRPYLFSPANPQQAVA